MFWFIGIIRSFIFYDASYKHYKKFNAQKFSQYNIKKKGLVKGQWFQKNCTHEYLENKIYFWTFRIDAIVFYSSLMFVQKNAFYFYLNYPWAIQIHRGIFESIFIYKKKIKKLHLNFKFVFEFFLWSRRLYFEVIFCLTHQYF